MPYDTSVILDLEAFDPFSRIRRDRLSAYWSNPDHARPYALYAPPVRTDWCFATLNPAGQNAGHASPFCGVGSLLYGHREVARTGSENGFWCPERITDGHHAAAVLDVLAISGCIDLPY